MDVQLRNLIAKENIIDPELCDSIIEKSKEWEWQKHQWYSHHDEYSHSHKLDLMKIKVNTFPHKDL